MELMHLQIFKSNFDVAQDNAGGVIRVYRYNRNLRQPLEFASHAVHLRYASSCSVCCKCEHAHCPLHFPCHRNLVCWLACYQWVSAVFNQLGKVQYSVLLVCVSFLLLAYHVGGMINVMVSLRIPTSSVDSLSLDGSNGDLLPQFVAEAHKNVRQGESIALKIDV